jgi:hypothetical protein
MTVSDFGFGTPIATNYYDVIIDDGTPTVLELSGVVRNEDRPGATIPELYLDSLPYDPSAAPWNPAASVPDVVVVNLGTNDFSPGSSSRWGARSMAR